MNGIHSLHVFWELIEIILETKKNWKKMKQK